MLDEIERVEYCVQDSQNRVELDVGKGSPLFNLAAAMSDETEHLVEEGWDPDETQASESQLREHEERIAQTDVVHLSMQQGRTDTQVGVVNGNDNTRGSGEVSTEVSGDEDEGSAGGEEQERQTTDKHKGQQGEGPSSRQGLNPRGEGTSSGQGKQPQEEPRRRKRQLNVVGQ